MIERPLVRPRRQTLGAASSSSTFAATTATAVASMSRGIASTATAVATAAALAVAAAFAAPAVPAAAPVAAQDASDGDALTLALEGFDFREIGPATMGGRVSDIGAVKGSPNTFYVGYASGGLWKTESHGRDWTPLFDDQPVASIGAVTVAPSNPNVVWVGTGEPQNRQSSPYGGGVFRSLDAGRSWEMTGLAESRHVGRIVIHPRDPEVVYVAAVGHLWGANEERGVFRTTDGGETWEKVLYIDENTGAIDLVMDRNDPRTLFAAMYQRRRTPWGFSADGPGSGIYRTLDGGETWEELREGLPEGDLGRIGLDVYRRDGDLVYAVVESRGDGRGLYRSTDRGESWEKVSDRNPRPMYFSLVRIDPNNPERIYLGGVTLSISDDGGRTWWDGDAADGVHLDHHALWIDPDDSDHVILGNDGGVASSRDGGRHWAHHHNVAVGQFYQISVGPDDPYRVCGGLQDNNSWCGPSHSLKDGGRMDQPGPMNGDWQRIWGGDGFWAVIDPSDPDIVWAESQNGNFGRYHVSTGESVGLRPPARPTPESEDREYRFHWNTPLHISSHDAATVYVGANHLLRTTDRGHSWEEASPDLTRQIDRDTLPIMGMEVTDSTLSEHDGVSDYGAISEIGESPLDPDVLYAGTDDGKLWVSRDGGGSWSDLTDRVPDFGHGMWVSALEASHHEPGRVYLAFDGHKADDYRPFVLVSENYGQDWRRIVSGLPGDASVNTLREHPRTPELLFVGNEVGLYVSVDRGASWHRFTADLPTVPVDDIRIHPRDNDLVLGTHGRSIWILDDLGPLEQIARGGVLSEAAALFDGQRGTQWVLRPGAWFEPAEFIGEDPPRGVLVRYWLGQDVGDDVTLEISDGTGEVLRTLEGPGERGIQRVLWDFEMETPVEGTDDAVGGPEVAPGSYAVRLLAGENRATSEVSVRLDPRIDASPAVLAARRDALERLHALSVREEAIERGMDAVEDRLEQAREVLEEAAEGGGAEALLAEADSLEARLEEVDDLLDEADFGLAGRVQGIYERPTEDQLWALERGEEKLPAVFAPLNALIADVNAFTARVYQDAARPPQVEPVTDPGAGG